MSEREYMNADYEVIGMVNRGRGKGGELPSRIIHFIPEDNAESVISLDNRIRKIKAAMPSIMIAGAIMLAFVIGLAV